MRSRTLLKQQSPKTNMERWRKRGWRLLPGKKRDVWSVRPDTAAMATPPRQTDVWIAFQLRFVRPSSFFLHRRRALTSTETHPPSV